MPSDFDSIAICACVSCGRNSDQVALKRLNTYSRAWACYDCVMKHGVEALTPEVDRQFGECVGAVKRVGYCRGLGGRHCGSVVYVRADGTLPWFCEDHEREWRQDFEEGWNKWQSRA